MKTPQGVLILNVEPRNPAALAGLREDDLLVGFQHQTVTSLDDLQRLLVGSEIGVKSALAMVRQRFRLDLEVTPSEMPS